MSVNGPKESLNSFGAAAPLNVNGEQYQIYRLDAVPGFDRLPYSLKILGENLLRTEDGANITADHIRALANWDRAAEPSEEIQFTPARVVMQDFTGVPCIVDLATMREAVSDLGGDPARVNPLAPAELVIDHSVQLDFSGRPDAFARNVDMEYHRNHERYQFLRWGQNAFEDFVVVPPGTGIVHQVNLEFLARGVMTKNGLAYPDTCVGTDSHTTMVNGLGVLGWGVGGIEAEAAMLGQPVSMLIPRVVGFKLTGEIQPGVTATDVVLTITEMLRQHGVVGKFVEFYGEGVAAVPLANRATIGNMSPEFGCTCAIFPIDDVTLDYLRLTGRSEEQVGLVEAYAKTQGLWHDPGFEPEYSEHMELDLSTVVPSIAGPKRPQDRIPLDQAKTAFEGAVLNYVPAEIAAPFQGHGPDGETAAPLGTHGERAEDERAGLHLGGLDEAVAETFPASDPIELDETVDDIKADGASYADVVVENRENETKGGFLHDVADAFRSGMSTANPDRRPHKHIHLELSDGSNTNLDHGDVVIASITSCTNTSNPSVMLAAGLLAQNAVAKGLKSKPWVKTSMAPGSKVVTDYYEKAGMWPALDQLGFNLAAYGCATCIGNSGPLAPEISAAINEHDLAAVSVLSGNRNFEGRINPDVKMNYLASPPLVIAYALAGTMDFDFENQPLGEDGNGTPVYLKDIWPSPDAIQQAVDSCIDREMFVKDYADVFAGDDNWRALAVPAGDTFSWNNDSTYVRKPPYFDGMPAQPQPVSDVHGARVLALLGDSVTTDHISPAGSIKADSPAGRYLSENGVALRDFNSYGSRRGNHEVMIRGTFANIRLRNLLLASENNGAGVEGGYTRDFTNNKVESIYDAAQHYAAKGIPLVVLGGKEYGSGSSRDWAAKGTALLGVKAVIAESFERIHRSNLIGMGVLPLQFPAGENAASLGLDGTETFDITGITELNDGHTPATVHVVATKGSAEPIEFDAIVRIDTPGEADYYRNGGILQYVLRSLAK